MASLIRQNFDEECEALINKQINMELYASYFYLSMAHYYERHDTALYGFSKFFRKNSDEEREHAQLLMKYQNERGGRIVLQDVAKPTPSEFNCVLDAFKAALDLEKNVNTVLLSLHEVAGKHGDAHLCDFLESHFLNEQVEAIKELGDIVTKVGRAGPGVGEHIIDKEFQSRD